VLRRCRFLTRFGSILSSRLRAGNRISWDVTGAEQAEWAYHYDGRGRLDWALEQLSQCGPDFQYDGEGGRIWEDRQGCEGDPHDEFKYTAEGRMVEHRKTYDGPGGARLIERRIYWDDALGWRILLHSPDSTAVGSAIKAVEDYGTWRFYYAGNDLIARSETDPVNPDNEAKSPYGVGAWFTPGLAPNPAAGGPGLQARSGG
jgi:hypothetical protein